MIIKDVFIYTEEQTFRPGAVRIVGERISQVWLGEEASRFEKQAQAYEECLDGHGFYLVPGMIDIHLHGCKGYDFCDGTLEAVKEIARYQAAIGVTTFVPATMTLPVEQLENILQTGEWYVQEKKMEKLSEYADLGGINMEGPFISKEKKGAQNGAYILAPEVAVFARFQKAANGLVKYIGLAPEAEGAQEFVRQVSGLVKVSVAHSNADYETVMNAFRAGVRHVTHLYNAMPPFHHREPGIIGAVMDEKGVEAELICDGVHVHPAVIRSTFTLLGAERTIMISDSMRATGMPDGSYELGGQRVEVQGKLALLEDGTIAGSVSSLPDCLRYVVQVVGIPLEVALSCVTINPAKSLGIYQECGSISVGKKADLVLLGRNLETIQVIKRGQML